MVTFLEFWGPYFPVFFGETTSEAGGSTNITAWNLFWYRLFCAITTMSLGVLGILWHQTFAHRLDRYSELFTAFSFSILTVCSWQHATGRMKSDSPARIAGPLHHTSASLSLLVLVKFWIARYAYFTWFQKVVNVVPFFLILVDFILGATLRFRISYIFFPQIPVAFHAVWLNFAWSGFVLHHLGKFFLRHVVLFIISIVACAVSRLPALFANRGQTQSSSDDPEAGGLTKEPERSEGYSW